MKVNLRLQRNHNDQNKNLAEVLRSLFSPKDFLSLTPFQITIYGREKTIHRKKEHDLEPTGEIPKMKQEI